MPTASDKTRYLRALRISWLVPLLAAVGAVGTLAPALAQPAPTRPAAPPQKPRGAHALDLAKEGVGLYQAQKYDDALARFTAAEALVHSPVFLLYQARCLREENKLLAAHRLFRQVANEALSDAPPPPWQRAKEDAASEEATLRAKLAQLVLTVANGSPATRVTLDGEPITQAALAGGTVLLPGKHQLVIRDGSAKFEETLQLPAGEVISRQVTLTRPTQPVSPAPAPALLPNPPPDITPIPARAGSLAPGLVTLAAGGALGIAGGVLGGVALSQAAAVREACEGVQFCADQRDERDGAIALGHGATVLLALAGASAAAGVVLLVVQPGGEDAPSAQVSVRLAPGWLGVSGRF